jgi:hypothetical protein
MNDMEGGSKHLDASTSPQHRTEKWVILFCWAGILTGAFLMMSSIFDLLGRLDAEIDRGLGSWILRYGLNFKQLLPITVFLTDSEVTRFCIGIAFFDIFSLIGIYAFRRSKAVGSWAWILLLILVNIPSLALLIYRGNLLNMNEGTSEWRFNALRIMYIACVLTCSGLAIPGIWLLRIFKNRSCGFEVLFKVILWACFSVLLSMNFIMTLRLRKGLRVKEICQSTMITCGIVMTVIGLIAAVVSNHRQ